MEAARALGVTQAYLSMMEKERRPLSVKFVRKAHRVLQLPATALPLPSETAGVSAPHDYSAELGALGYPGFAYLRGKTRRNPAEVLFDALNESDLDTRVAEGLPWLILNYADMDWVWLVRQCKLCDRQNRLGFALFLATEAEIFNNDRDFQPYLGLLENARLAREDTFCHDSMTQAERAWLRERRSAAAAHWNLLTDMTGEQLANALQSSDS